MMIPHFCEEKYVYFVNFMCYNRFCLELIRLRKKWGEAGINTMGNELKLYASAALFVILIACLASRDYQKERTRLFIWLLLMDIGILLTETQITYYSALTAERDSPFVLHLLSCIVQILSYGMTMVFNHYLYMLVENETRVKMWPVWVVDIACAIMSIVWTLAIWNPRRFGFTPERYTAWSLRLFDLIVDWTIGISLAMTIIRHWKELGIRTTLAMLSFFLFPALSLSLRAMTHNVGFMSLAFSLSLMITYHFNFVQQRQMLLEQDKQLEEERTAIMMSQIQPHFIYNVLNSIYYLCKVDADKAREAIKDFSEYLRANLKGIEQDRLIPFSRELEHVRHYLNLETMRFGDDLKVEMDLQTVDFMLPPLTLQPLVENAVKHGLLKKEEGGTIRIETLQKGNNTIVKIQDDGNGFDPEMVKTDGQVHIGLSNVTDRLWNLCKGTMEIKSVRGKGTLITITVPTQRINEKRDTEDAYLGS